MRMVIARGVRHDKSQCGREPIGIIYQNINKITKINYNKFHPVKGNYIGEPLKVNYLMLIFK